MARALIVVAAAASIYAFYIEALRGRAFWKLVTWLKEERPDAWEAARAARGSNIEYSVADLRRGRLSGDIEFAERHDATTRRGRRMAIALTVAGAAIVALLAGVTLFDLSI